MDINSIPPPVFLLLFALAVVLLFWGAQRHIKKLPKGTPPSGETRRPGEGLPGEEDK